MTTPEEAWLPISVLASDGRYEIGHFDALAKALEAVLNEDLWRRFRRPDTEELQEYEADEFGLFLVTPPTRGCGLELDGLRAVLRARHREDLDNRVNDLTSGEAQKHGGKGSGTTFDGERDASYVLGRLKRDQPELAARVASGTISANAAAIEAGIRHRYLRVRSDDINRALDVLLDHYTLDELYEAIVKR